MKRVSVIICLAVLFAFIAGNSFADVLKKEFNKKIDFVVDGNIIIENTNGRIEVTSWQKKTVEIFAEIKVRSGNSRRAREIFDEIRIIVDNRGDRLKIKADYPGKRDNNGLISWIFGKSVNVKVDFYIRVPVECNLESETVNGQIQVLGLKGGCNLSSVNGAVIAEDLCGDVHAKTTNGSIRVEITKLASQNYIDLHTVNGSIKLILPDNPSATVRASTVNGNINTDFDIIVHGKYNSKKLGGKIGHGDADIRLKTVNGSINIR